MLVNGRKQTVFDETNAGGQNGFSGKVTLTGFKTTVDQQQGQEGISQATLPPCRICGESATGLHYGVNSCDACKAFFQRALARKKLSEFKCKCNRQKNGRTNPARKMMCPKCRYDRCIAEGMSKDAIKIGRYTLTRKRQNTAEVKMRLESGERSQQSAVDASLASDSSGISVDDSMPEQPVTAHSPKKQKQCEGKREEDGLLYKAFTESIYSSLRDNRQDPASTPPHGQKEADISPMQKLYMQPFDPSKHDQTITEQNGVTKVTTPPIAMRDEVPEMNFPPTEDLGGGGVLIATPVALANQNAAVREPANDLHVADNIFEVSPPIVSSSVQPDTEHNVECQQQLVDGSIPHATDTFATIELKTLPDFPQENGWSTADSCKLTLDDVEKECPSFDCGGIPIDCGGIPNELYAADEKAVVGNELSPVVDHVTGDTKVQQGRALPCMERYLKPRLSPGDGISVEEIQTIIQHLLDSKMSIFMEPLQVSEEEIRERHAIYLEQYQLKQELFGDMSDLSVEEYLEVYNQTGMNIDNRQEIVVETLRYIEDSIRKMVKFAKCVPGFTQLLLEDQVNLIKASRKEHDVIQYGPCTSLTPGVNTTPWNKDYHIDEILRAFPNIQKVFEAKQHLYGNMKELNLTTEAAIVLCGMVLTFTDRCDLKAPDAVNAIHDKLIACLHYLLNQYEPGTSRPSIQDIVGFVYSIRDLARLEKELIYDAFEIWPAAKNHQLAKEMMS